MIDRFSRWLTHHTKLILVIAFLLLIPSAIGYLNTYVNYDILSYLPDDLDSVKGQQVLDETFHNSASTVLIVENMPAKDVAALKEKVSKVEGVHQVTWIDDILDIGVPEDILPDEIKNVFYSQKTNATMMLVQYDHSSASEETMKAIGEIRCLMNKQCFLSGLSTISLDTKELADSEAPIYIAIAIALAMVAMTLSLKSWILPWVLLLGLSLAVVYNFGTNIFFGQISYITQCIAAILQLGVTMDYSVFLVDRYEEEREKGGDHRDAMARAVSNTFLSLSGSSLTTIFGFLALCFMRLTLGRDIGLVMAKGVVLGVITVVIVLPALILAFDKPIHRFTHRSLIPSFNRMNSFILKHRRVLIAVGLLIAIPACIGQNNVTKYYNIDRGLPQDLPSIVSLNKMKDAFNMATTHFVIVDDTLPASKLTEMSAKLEQVDGIETVLSYNKFLGPAIEDSFVPEEIKEICKKDGKQLLMINSSFSAATEEENEQIDEMTAIVKSYDSGGMITGEGPLTKDLTTIADKDFIVTSILSTLAIFIIVAICFKSLTIPIVVVGSIELAIFINEAIPFFTGTVIPFIAPTVISCVQLGATVDYAILLTTRFREELQRGHDRMNAMRIAANAADRSIMSSALVFFCATFGVYLTCNIEMIKSICSMLARGSVISAIVIFFFLTPLLLVCERIISKTSLSWSGTKPNGRSKKANGRPSPVDSSGGNQSESKKTK
ncbi:MAG: efflux RND transporter permease subunit [Clostridiales bacterium]|nr:efflux RND transporter permease subunit [Clostridiales bacterium]